MGYNKDAVRLVADWVKETISGAVEKAVSGISAGSGDALPSKADFIGQLFRKTGDTNPGLYVSTGTTTPGWKAISHEA